MKYEVEFAKFVSVEVEADSKKEAEDIAEVMETEVIETCAILGNDDSYQIWDVKEKG